MFYGITVTERISGICCNLDKFYYNEFILFVCCFPGSRFSTIMLE